MLRVARLAVVGVWIALLAALARSHLPAGPTDAMDAAAVEPAPPELGDEWMGLYMAEQKIGYAHSRIRRADDGYRLEQTSHMRLSVLDEVQNVTATIAATTGPDYALRTFSVGLSSDLGQLDVEGRVAGDALQLRMRTPADSSEQRLPLGQALYLPSAARARLRSLGLAAGRAVTLSVFDPSSLDHHPLELRVGGRETVELDGRSIEAWKVSESFRGMTTEVWIDDAGRTVREQGPMGLVAVREDAARALGAGWGAEPFDLMGAVAVPASGDAIDDPRGRRRLTARVSGAAAAMVPNDQRQRVEAGLLSIAVEDGLAATYALPYAGADRRDELRATPFLQSEHPRLRAAAAEALAGTVDPVQAAIRLRQWVYRRLDKRPLATIPNAVQVLEIGAGDCNEHAVLFAALARASGLPARVVAGIVHADGRFLYHAWNEVWLGTRWVSVDAAFDQMPADATHVKLLAGGPEVHADLVPLIGGLSFEIVPEPPRASR